MALQVCVVRLLQVEGFEDHGRRPDQYTIAQTTTNNDLAWHILVYVYTTYMCLIKNCCVSMAFIQETTTFKAWGSSGCPAH